MNQSCKTCKWAKWPKGRIRNDRPGDCIYPLIAEMKLPECSKAVMPERINDRYAIWHDDGATCKCYEKL